MLDESEIALLKQAVQWQYVLATVEVAAHRLDALLNGQPIKSFDYR